MQAIQYGAFFLKAFQGQFCENKNEFLRLDLSAKLKSQSHEGLLISLNMKDLSLGIEKDSGMLLSSLSLEMAYMEEALIWLNDYLKLKKWDQELKPQLQGKLQWPAAYQFETAETKKLEKLSSFLMKMKSQEEMQYQVSTNKFIGTDWSLSFGSANQLLLNKLGKTKEISWEELENQD